MFFETIFTSSLLVITIYFTLMPILKDITEKVVFPGTAPRLTAYIFFITTLGSFFSFVIKEFYSDSEIFKNLEMYLVLSLTTLFTIGLIGIFYVTYHIIKKTLRTE